MAHVLWTGRPSCHPVNSGKEHKALTLTSAWPGLVLSTSTTGLLAEGALFPLRRLSVASTMSKQNYNIKAIYSYVSFSFWATVCKTVRPMLSYRCLFCLSVPSVCLSCLSRWTLVYSGQTAGWIRMTLGTEVDLGPGQTVLDGDAAPNKRGTVAPTFRPMSIVAKRLD